MRSIALAFLLGILPAVGFSEPKVLLPGKTGYAIMPVQWFSVECLGEELTYKTSGREKKVELPRHVRACLQHAYEDICSPSEEATPDVFKGLYGPVNIIREEKHTLWVVPMHLEDGGFAMVFMQKTDGAFEPGCMTIGLEGALPPGFSVPEPAK
ncbi:MAG: hypothetical protein AB7F75_10950 [Planctomycetota bacterium]